MIKYLIIAAAFAILCLIFFLIGKRSWKTYALLAVLAGVAVLVVSLVNFSSEEEYYNSTTEAPKQGITTTIKISCDTINGEKENIPADGIILDTTEVTLSENSSVYDQLVEATKCNKIQFETDNSIVEGYVAGLAYIYGGDFGDLSGWMFKLNGNFSDMGSNDIKLSDGDFVEWVYTKDMGADVGYVYGE